MHQEKLYIRFQQLFRKLATNDHLLNEYWQELVQFYGEKHRAYHNLIHLDNMFDVLATHQQSFILSDGGILDWAIFYHDIIYSIKANAKNEEKSADIAVKRLDTLGLSKERQQLCYQLILSTQKHQPLVDQVENRLLIDLDLAILGKSNEAYLEYTQQIREEYSLYPNFIYNKGRKKAMKQFLERPRIYQTDYFYERLEQSARANILAEMGEG